MADTNSAEGVPPVEEFFSCQQLKAEPASRVLEAKRLQVRRKGEGRRTKEEQRSSIPTPFYADTLITATYGRTILQSLGNKWVALPASIGCKEQRRPARSAVSIFRIANWKG
jgi:hypothetical protein